MQAHWGSIHTFNFSFSEAGNLRMQLEKYTVDKSQTIATSVFVLFSTRRFKSRFYNIQLGEPTQIQLMWLGNFQDRSFEESFESTQWRKSDKCYQCDFTCSDSSSLKMHMEIHSGKKLNKCNGCAYACSQASELKNHLTNLTNAANMTMHFPGQAFWGVD